MPTYRLTIDVEADSAEAALHYNYRLLSQRIEELPPTHGPQCPKCGCEAFTMFSPCHGLHDCHYDPDEKVVYANWDEHTDMDSDEFVVCASCYQKWILTLDPDQEVAFD